MNRDLASSKRYYVGVRPLSPRGRVHPVQRSGGHSEALRTSKPAILADLALSVLEIEYRRAM